MSLQQTQEQWETPSQQIERLANFIMNNIPGEPSKSEGAIDTAMRILSSSRTELLKELKGKAEMMKLNADPSLSSLKRKDGKVLDYYACKAYDLCIDDFIALLEKEIK